MAVTSPAGKLLNKLNDLWRYAEREMTNTGITIPTSIKVKVLINDITTEIAFGWKKKFGRWHICVDMPPYADGTPRLKPITEVPLELRMQLAQHYEQLRQKTKENEARLLPDIQAAINILDESIYNIIPDKQHRGDEDEFDDEDEDVDDDDED